MEEWVQKALARWPDVPAVYGWLGLDRRGRSLIRGEPITRPQIIDTIARNYAADEHGRWYFQNGPQRGYLQLAYAPLVLFASADGDVLRTHAGDEIKAPRAAYLDEEGSLLLVSEHGPGLLVDTDLDWALDRLRVAAAGTTLESALAAALVLPSGADTGLLLPIAGRVLTLRRLDAAELPARLGFVRDPQPRPGERAVVGDLLWTGAGA